MDCRTCGTPLPADATHCARCGTPVAPAAPTTDGGWVAPGPPPGWAPPPPQPGWPPTPPPPIGPTAPAGTPPPAAPWSGTPADPTWAAPGAPSSDPTWAAPGQAWGPPGAPPADPTWAPPGQQWAPPGTPTWGPPPAGPPPGGTWGAAPPPTPAARPRRRVGLVLAAIGVVAVLGVGALAVQALVGGSGGASTPEGAVQRLADAIAAEDPVAAAAALAPDEIGSLADLLAEVEETAGESGFVPEDDTFAGLDLTAEDLEYDVDKLGDSVARVEVVDGELGFTFAPDELSPEARELAGDDLEGSSDSVDIGDLADEAGEDPYLVTVRRGGGWYVSIAYTVAEYALEGMGLPDADYDDDVDQGEPSEEPEGAVTELVEAFVQGDIDALMTHLPEAEASVVAPYRDALDEIFGETTSGDEAFTVDEVRVEAGEELADGARRVRILGATGTVDSDEDEITWELDGFCIRFEGFEDEYEDEFIDSFTDELCEVIEDSYLGGVLQPEGPSVVVVPERGGWVVSPVETVMLTVRDILPRLDHDTIVTLAGRPDLVAPEGEAPFGEVFEVALGEAGVATRTVTAPRDVELIVSTGDEEADVSLVTSDGEEVEDGDDGYLLTEGGTYVLVVQRVTRDGDAPVAVALGEAVEDDLGEVSLSGTIAGTLTPAGPVRRTSFTLDREVTAEIEVDGDVYIDVLEDGELICAEGDECSFDPGYDYTLVVRRPFDEPLSTDDLDYEVSFEIVPEEPADDPDSPNDPDDPEIPEGVTEATIDGETSVEGYLDSEGAAEYHEIIVPEGESVVVSIMADEAGEDIDAYLDGDYYEDGGDETIYLDGPIYDEIEVFLFSDGPTGYTITIEPG